MSTTFIKGMSVIKQGGRKMLLYNQFDFGNKYKIYINIDGHWTPYYSSKLFSEAMVYYDKICSKEERDDYC